MVKINVKDFVDGADSAADGVALSAPIKQMIQKNDTILVSFAGINSASSSFVSAGLIPILLTLGFDEFKRRIRIIDASWQIVDVIKRRVLKECEPA